MIVTGALSDPIMISPYGPASAKSAGEGVSSARAGLETAKPALMPVNAKANGAAELTNWRRVNDKAASKVGCLHEWLPARLRNRNVRSSNVALTRHCAKGPNAALRRVNAGRRV